MGPFESIEETFRSYVNCKQILIDKYKLPKDQCVAISESIQCGTTRVISDGSFYHIDQLGTSALIIFANKKKFISSLVGTRYPELKKIKTCTEAYWQVLMGFWQQFQ